MHLKLPKPLHGWRAFAGEVGIVVLGVILALAFGEAAFRPKQSLGYKLYEANSLAGRGGVISVSKLSIRAAIVST